MNPYVAERVRRPGGVVGAPESVNSSSLPSQAKTWLSAFVVLIFVLSLERGLASSGYPGTSQDCTLAPPFLDLQ